MERTPTEYAIAKYVVWVLGSIVCSVDSLYTNKREAVRAARKLRSRGGLETEVRLLESGKVILGRMER